MHETEKVYTEIKMLSPLSMEDYATVTAKSNRNNNITYSLHSMGSVPPDIPIRICHTIMHLAFNFKIFGADAFGNC